jgi:hypothetical protein
MKNNEPKYCDTCQHLNFTEQKQDDLRKQVPKVYVDHKCGLTNNVIFHKNEHPRLPTPCNCPLEK